MKVSIVIPNYNTQSLLEKNLPKVLSVRGDAEVIVVDDSSTDDSLDVLKKFDVKVIANERNLGFSSTVNRGVEEASGDIIVLLNTDVVPEKDFLEPLIAHFKDPQIFAVGCMDKSMENGTVALRGRGLGKFQRGFLVHRRGEVDENNTLWVSGGSGAFRKSIWKKLGGMNRLYNPFYWEDIDLSYRATKSGYKLVFEQNSVVEHRHEEGSIKKNYSQFQVKTIAYRNQIMFVWLNVTDLDLRFQHLLWLPYQFFKALLRWDIAFFAGFLQAFVRLPRIIHYSLKAQRYFKRSDEEVIKEFS